MLPYAIIDVREYLDATGRSPFGKWFKALDSTAAAKVTIAIVRMTQGHLSNVKAVGEGVLEYKIHFGPGYRIYFGRHGNELVILLAGGTKKHQFNDIQMAKTRWNDYKRRKN
jgi:putative addiction module killer protein